jgi:hypothetical protein
MRQTITFTIQVDVDAEAVSKLPGYPGTGNPATAYGDEDLPVSGIDIECSLIATELARKVKDLLPARLEPLVWDRDYKISKPQYIQSGVF